MEIIFGIGNSKIKTHFTKDYHCNNCNNNTSFIIETRKYFFSIFFIPIIPLHKKVVSICSHCGNKSEYEQWSNDLKDKHNQLIIIDPPKTPLWLYSGCLGVLGVMFLIILLIIVALFIKVKDEMTPNNQDKIYREVDSLNLDVQDEILDDNDTIEYGFERKIDTFKGVSNKLRDEVAPKDSIKTFFIK